MAIPLTAIALIVPLLGAFWQFFLSDILFIAYGIGRNVQPISDFPYTCHKIIDPQVEACEDMWLDEKSRTLYLACSDVISRTKWMPKYG
jgi:arylesterase / paraoxonase